MLSFSSACLMRMAHFARNNSSSKVLSSFDLCWITITGAGKLLGSPSSIWERTANPPADTPTTTASYCIALFSFLACLHKYSLFFVDHFKMFPPFGKEQGFLITHCEEPEWTQAFIEKINNPGLQLLLEIDEQVPAG